MDLYICSMKLTIQHKFILTVLLSLSWIPILFFDGVYFSKHFAYGKLITSILVIAMTIILFAMANLKQRFLMTIMVPLSWLGEMLCCVYLDMYDYRGNQIPLYVPFGHASIFTLCWLLTQYSGVLKQNKTFKKWMTYFYLASFAFVILILNDTLSLALGILFYFSLKRKNFSPFYLMMGLLVLYLEIIGTYFGCWKWDANQWIFTTVNPPLGAIFIYVGGDMILGRLSRFILRMRKKTLQKKYV